MKRCWQGGRIMEVIMNWEIFNAASLAFCQFQGMIGIISISGIAIFKFNLGGKVSIQKYKIDNISESS
jgi:hypothetical protein